MPPFGAITGDGHGMSVGPVSGAPVSGVPWYVSGAVPEFIVTTPVSGAVPVSVPPSSPPPPLLLLPHPAIDPAPASVAASERDARAAKPLLLTPSLRVISVLLPCLVANKFHSPASAASPRMRSRLSAIEHDLSVGGPLSSPNLLVTYGQML